MKIHLQLQGSGTDADPYRVPLPSYTALALDYIGLTAIVDAPAGDIPAVVSGLDSSHFSTYANGMTALANCPAGALAAWHTLLDQRYPAQAGQFRPQVTT